MKSNLYIAREPSRFYVKVVVTLTLTFSMSACSGKPEDEEQSNTSPPPVKTQSFTGRYGGESCKWSDIEFTNTGTVYINDSYKIAGAYAIETDMITVKAEGMPSVVFTQVGNSLISGDVECEKLFPVDGLDGVYRLDIESLKSFVLSMASNEAERRMVEDEFEQEMLVGQKDQIDNTWVQITNSRVAVRMGLFDSEAMDPVEFESDFSKRSDNLLLNSQSILGPTFQLKVIAPDELELFLSNEREAALLGETDFSTRLKFVKTDESSEALSGGTPKAAERSAALAVLSAPEVEIDETTLPTNCLSCQTTIAGAERLRAQGMGQYAPELTPQMAELCRSIQKRCAEPPHNNTW